MKVISGGGGVDADGNWYELPTIEREVPDDYLAKLRAAFKRPQEQYVMLIDPAIYDQLKQ